MSEIHGVGSKIVLGGHDYWLAKKGDRLMPARGDLDPLLEIPRLVPNILLFDVLRNPLDFRYRLVGSRVRTHLMNDLTGLKMSGIEYQREPSKLWSNHVRVVESPQPLFSRPPYVGPHRDFMYIETVVLPLGLGDRVNMLLVFVDFVPGR